MFDGQTFLDAALLGIATALKKDGRERARKVALTWWQTLGDHPHLRLEVLTILSEEIVAYEVAKLLRDAQAAPKPSKPRRQR